MRARIARLAGTLGLFATLVAVGAPAPALARTSGAKLVERSVSVTPAAAQPGATVAIKDTVANVGGRRSRASTSTFFLARRRSRQRGDLRLGSRRVPSLKVHKAWAGRVRVRLPSSASTGAGFVLACRAHGQCSSARFRVIPRGAPVLHKLTVTASHASIAEGLTDQFTASGTFSDGSTRNLTASAIWSTTNGSVAAISNTAGTQGLASALGIGATTIVATVDGTSGTAGISVTAPIVQSIVVSPAAPRIANLTTVQFTATGTFSDGTTANITNSVTWSSDATVVATISNAAPTAGLATATGPGLAFIFATDPATGASGQADLTVTSAVLQSIAVTPANPSIPKGLTQQFTATGTFSDNSTQDLTTDVTWASSNTAVTTISGAHGSNGLARALTPGPTNIRAAFAGVTGSTVLTVTAPILESITVTPADPSVAKGLTEQFTATATFSDNSTQDLTTAVTWSSVTTSVATISNTNRGLATAVSPGTSTIKATESISGIQGSTTLTVTPPVLQSIAVTPANPSVAHGATEQFTATGTFSDNTTQDITSSVTWSSSDHSVATISTGGLATTLMAGSSIIRATDPATQDARSTVLTAT